MITLIKIKKDYCVFSYEGLTTIAPKVLLNDLSCLHTNFFFRYKNYNDPRDEHIESYNMEWLFNFPKSKDSESTNVHLAPFLFTHYIHDIEFPFEEFFLIKYTVNSMIDRIELVAIDARASISEMTGIKKLKIIKDEIVTCYQQKTR